MLPPSILSFDTVRLLSARRAARAFALAIPACALAGCSSMTTSPTASQLRVIDTSPDAPAVDVYQGSGALAYNLGFGTLTSYVSLGPGTYTLSVHTAGSTQQLTSSRASTAAAAQYTLLVGSTAGTMQQTFLKDQATPAPAGQVSLRFLDQAVHGGSLDLYLVPSGSRSTGVSPLLSNVIFGANSGYLNIQAGTYSVMAFPAGITPGPGSAPVFTGPSISYPALSAKTIILLDHPTQNMQIITASDFDPAGTQ